MSNRIDPIEDWPKGDTRILPFTVMDEDNGGRLDITNADISWLLHDNVENETVLSVDDNDVTLDLIDAVNGEFEVVVDKNATTDISGRFREVIEITDSEGHRHTWISRIKIDTL